jgi:osmotically-inducible protein OsmY
LRIDASADDGTLRAMPGFAPDDRDIAQAVLDAYAVDPRVRPFAPTINVRNGVVVLTGIAPDARALRAAEEDARNVPGVAQVRDVMRERSAVSAESDERVLSDVRVAMTLDPRLGSLHIAVGVRRGRVYLRGAVPTTADRMQAIALASSVPGAIDVDDDLAVVPVGIGVANAQPEP